MAHQSLYRRYRPQRFAEVRGQATVVNALRTALKTGKLPPLPGPITANG